MLTCIKTPPLQQKLEDQPPEDKAQEEDPSLIFPVPCSLGMHGGTGYSVLPDPQDMK